MKKLLVVTALLVMALAAPALASHDPNAVGCEKAHECFSDVAKWFPPSSPENTTAIVVWNPMTSQYEAGYAYGLAALCQNYGGYYYLDFGGEYWNAC